MFRALALSVAQLGDPVFLRVLAKSLALTLLLFAAGGYGLYWLLVSLFAWLGWNGAGGGLAAAVGAVLLATVAGWLLFRAVAVAVISLFSDEVLAAVERRHYPDRAAAAVPAGWFEQIEAGAASMLRAIGWNLVALPFYILLVPTGLGTPILVFAVNALLLARDLGDLVALRHVPRGARRDWLRATRDRRIRLGLVAAGLFVIPVVNLLAPILGAAMAAHLLHGGDRIHAQASRPHR